MSDIDWIAEAKRIVGDGYESSYEDDHCYISGKDPFYIVELRYYYAEGDEPASFCGYGHSEWTAARDAVLKLYALAKLVLPEYAEAVQHLRDQLDYSMVGEHTAAEWRELLARIDAKQGQR